MKNTIAQEIQEMYTRYPAEIVDALVDAWAVKVQTCDIEGCEPSYIMEDGSAICKVERIATRTKQFAGDIPAWRRPHYRMNLLFDIADLSKINPELAKQMLAANWGQQ